MTTPYESQRWGAGVRLSREALMADECGGEFVAAMDHAAGERLEDDRLALEHCYGISNTEVQR